MTCEELRLYFEDPLRADPEFRIEAEHLVRCAECARFVEAQRELGAGLRRVREAVPQLPAGLDAAVLASYRRYLKDGPSPLATKRRFSVLYWGAAAAAIILMAGLAFFHAQRPAPKVVRSGPPEPSVASHPRTAEKIDRVSRLSKATSSPSFHRLRRTAPSGDGMEIPLSTGFRSLMYCDELSCSGPMQLIRVQLPSSGVASAPGLTAENDTVLADVLVGSDGIARGIRIVQ